MRKSKTGPSNSNTSQLRIKLLTVFQQMLSSSTTISSSTSEYDTISLSMCTVPQPLQIMQHHFLTPCPNTASPSTPSSPSPSVSCKFSMLSPNAFSHQCYFLDPP